MKPYRTGANLTGLQDLIRAHVKPGMQILEIGAFVGDSTREFVKAGANVLSVDPFDQQMPGYHVTGDILTEWAMKTRGYHGRAQAFVGTGDDYYRAAATSDPAYDTRFDLVYIDAVHTYEAVKHDIEECEFLLVPGGILAGHDYCPTHFPGVVQAVEEASDRLDLPVIVYPDTSWVIMPCPF